MTTVRKFMFDIDFDAPAGAEAVPAARADRKAPAAKAKPTKTAEPAPPPAEPAPPPPPPPAPTFSEAEVKAAADKARAEGQKAGETQGRAAAAAEIEQRIASAATAIQGQVTALQQDVATDRAAILSDATAIALAILRKMLPAYSKKGGLVEIEAVLTRCLQDQRREQRLVARVSPDLLAALEPRLAALSAETGFEGRLFLIADERLGDTDCTVEWADGGIERHADAIWNEVSAALDRCLALQEIPAPADLPADRKEKAAAEPATDTKTSDIEAASDAADNEDTTRSE